MDRDFKGLRGNCKTNRLIQPHASTMHPFAVQFRYFFMQACMIGQCKRYGEQKYRERGDICAGAAICFQSKRKKAGNSFPAFFNMACYLPQATRH